MSSVGKVNIGPYCKVEIIDGEIVIHGVIVSCKGNLFYSGDLGYIDDEVFLFINGRKNLANAKNM